jgi:hypothetical protein
MRVGTSLTQNRITAVINQPRRPAPPVFKNAAAHLLQLHAAHDVLVLISGYRSPEAPAAAAAAAMRCHAVRARQTARRRPLQPGIAAALAARRWHLVSSSGTSTGRHDNWDECGWNECGAQMRVRSQEMHTPPNAEPKLAHTYLHLTLSVASTCVTSA